MQSNFALSEILQVVQILAVLAGGFAVLLTMRGRLDQLEIFAAANKVELSAIKEELKAINKVITNQAVQDVKIAKLEDDIHSLQEWRERRIAGQRQ